MLVEELIVHDPDSSLWRTARPLLGITVQLEQNDASYTWHGWNKRQMSDFLKYLPSRCCLVIGVWETMSSSLEQEVLWLGLACEVVEGEVCSIRTLEALTGAGLKSPRQLEPGIEDALEIMRVAGSEIAPVAWALFTDKATWDEWLFTSAEDGGIIDKGELLAAFAKKGRCVLMGSQTTHHHR